MTNAERFNEFKANVQQWATDRGIYANGKASSQLLKALSELGELADAIAKNDRDGIADGIGDVAVCLVNYAYMVNHCIHAPVLNKAYDGKVNDNLGMLAMDIGSMLFHSDNLPFGELNRLCNIAALNGLYFLDCCDIAWNEIRHRKGFLNSNGVFVKE